MRETNVLIAGAGIGGLTAALCLHAAGIDAAVVESAHEIKPLGLGINLQPDAVGVLTRLGLGDTLAERGIATAEHVYADPNGTIHYTEPRGVDGDDAYPQYSIHRGLLQQLLLEATRERLGPQAVRTGARITHFEQDADGVRAETRDGHEHHAAILVGADGVHSSVRKQLHPAEGSLRWSGVTMWRGAAQVSPFRGGRSMAILHHEDGDRELIAYPISENVLNWVALAYTGEPGSLPEGSLWNEPVPAAKILPRFADWNLGWFDVPAMIEKTPEIIEYPMVDRDPLPSWGDRRVTLLGDAAHPMYPLGANGGSQTIVDAQVLADELVKDFPAGLARYADLRREATTPIVLANREMASSWGVRSREELERITRAYRDTTRNM